MKPDPATAVEDVILLPDAGPLITLAYAYALDLLFAPGWSVRLVDMVLHEVTRNTTPTSARLAAWVADKSIPVLKTRTLAKHLEPGANDVARSKNNLGELATQEAMQEFALTSTNKVGVFLFEDHRIAHASFLLPANCRKISTRAYLLFLERRGWIASATEVERRAIQAGRAFSQLRFPPD